MRTSIRVHQNQFNSNRAIQNNPRFNPHQNYVEDNQKPDTSHMFINRNQDQYIDDTLQLNTPNINPPQMIKTRKQLNFGVFFLVIAAQVAYTFYPAITFSRLNGEYQFFIMGFSLPIFYLMVSGYLLKDFGRFLPLYCLMDPLMVLTWCLVGVYVVPYVLLERKAVPEILELVGFGVCNLAMVGNFRVMMVEMHWQSCMVILYKLGRFASVLFYLGFGAYYRIKQVSYSKGSDTDLDSQVQYIVLLFVLSGFSLQMMIFNKLSQFDQSNIFRTNYEIIDEQQEGYYANNGEVQNIYYHQQQQDGNNESFNKNNVKKPPHYPSFSINQLANLSPPQNASQIKIVHNLNEIRKFQRKSARASIDVR